MNTAIEQFELGPARFVPAGEYHVSVSGENPRDFAQDGSQVLRALEGPDRGDEIERFASEPEGCALHTRESHPRPFGSPIFRQLQSIEANVHSDREFSVSRKKERKPTGTSSEVQRAFSTRRDTSQHGPVFGL